MTTLDKIKRWRGTASNFALNSAVLDPGAAIARRLRRAAITAERQEQLRIWRDNLVSDEVLHHIEEELDYQESHI